MIHILTDSTADLSPQMASQYQIGVIPLYVLLKDKSYRDGLETSLQSLFQFVKETGILPKTSAPSVGDFVHFLDGPGEHIYIGISSMLSATVKNAQLAVDTLGTSTVHVIDSLGISSWISLLVLRAAELRDEGKSADEISHEIQDCVPKVRSYIVLETLDYLYKGGRCSAIQNIMGSLLSIRPVLNVRADGTIGVRSKIRGNRKKCLQAALDEFRADLHNVDRKRIFITHTGCDEDAAFLKEEINRIADIDEVNITTAGSVIASHCGPGTIGILYMLKEGGR
jgi:DegV family protein with EDD domain